MLQEVLDGPLSMQKSDKIVGYTVLKQVISLRGGGTEIGMHGHGTTLF